MWGEYGSEPGVAKSSFLADREVRQSRVVGQSRIVFHSGLEWCMRDILKGVANLAVKVATASKEAVSSEVWERGRSS